MNAFDLLEYDAWATERALSSLLVLTSEEFARELGSGSCSVRGQAVHLVSVADRYRARLVGDPVPEVDERSFETGGQLLAYHREVAARMRDLRSRLADRSLEEEVRHETRRGVFVATIEQTILHVVNHSTYHRGQIAALLKVLGYEPTDTDLVIAIQA